MKTRLYTRKRALISSVAMLLVAMIALGTATFAWFTKSTTATASNIYVKTIKASELVISKLDKQWKTTVDYGMDVNSQKVLQPVSSADGSNWYHASAADKNSYASTSNAEVVEGSDAGNYYFKEQLNIKNKGEADVDDVQIQFALDSNSVKTSYVRIALVPVLDTDENTDFVPTPNEGDFFAYTSQTENEVTTNTLTNIYGIADTTGYKALKGTDLTSENKANSLTATVRPNSVFTVNVGTLKGDGKTLATGEKNTVYYNLYVWFEGQDEDCKDANAGAKIPNITFTVSGNTVQES